MHKKIKEICRTKNITINKLEKDLGFAKGYISKLDKSSPSFDNALKIAKYLNVDVNELA